MSTKTVDAVYERGTLRLLGTLPLREHAEVLLIIPPAALRTRKRPRTLKRSPPTILVYELPRRSR